MNKEELITKLIKEGKITFCEALILNKTEKEYVAAPYQVNPNPFIDSTWIWQPKENPYKTICNTIK
jgi:hypothetical protein